MRRSVSLFEQNHHQIDFMLQSLCVFRVKYSPINLLYIFETPIRKNTTGGLSVDRMVPMSTFLT